MAKLVNPASRVKKIERSPAYISDMYLDLIQAYYEKMTDALVLYLPLPVGEKFHASRSRVRLATGSNQSSKSQTGLAEVARIARGMDPYKKRADHDLRILILGPSEDHLATPVFSKLWKPGAFVVVPDEITGFPRAVRPDPKDPQHIDPIDEARRELWTPSPPMMPLDDKQISWSDKKLGVPKLVTLTNGTEIDFRSSMGDLKRGVEYDLAALEEEIEQEEWIPEAQARLLRRDGLFQWHVTPQHATKQLWSLHERAMRKEPDIEEFVFKIEDNPYISDAARKNFYEMLPTDQDRQVRYHGGYALMGRQRYPEFRPDSQHGVDPFEIPEDWMRMLVTDPGWQVCATLFAAVPPDASQIHIYDELYLKNTTGDQYGQEVAKRCTGFVWEFFLVDQKGGQQKQFTSGITQQEHLSNALAQYGIFSRRTGHGYFWGSPNLAGREGSLKKLLMRKGPNLPPTLVVHRGRVPNFEREMKNQWYKKNSPDERQRADSHTVDCAEYLAAFFDSEDPDGSRGLYYFPPLEAPSQKVDDSVYRAYQDKLARTRQRESGSAGRGVILASRGSAG